MKLALAEVYEVATFYAHFDVVADDQTPPPAVTIRVCDSIACQLAGAERLLTELNAGRPARRARAAGALHGAMRQRAGGAGGAQRHPACHRPSQCCKRPSSGSCRRRRRTISILTAIGTTGGYRLWQRCQSGDCAVEEVVQALDEAGLKGLGGAGFPAGRKWQIVRNYPGPRMLAVNADEGEPGTFKDRHYLETDPHRFIEGMLIAAWAVEARLTVVYVRDEYPEIVALIKAEIGKVVAAGLAAHTEIEVRRGAGAYICGEESAMIESIEGKRGLPRNRPPYVAEVGLFGRPTLEHNVETLFWVRDIVERGASWFADAGSHGRQGWRSYSVSGRVNNPGVKLAPAGTTVAELIEQYCGGMQSGHAFKAYLPGGASGGILPARLADVPLDFGTLQEYGCFIGSAAVVIFSDRDNMKDVALNLMRFFADESCGQCTPCRVGTEKSRPADAAAGLGHRSAARIESGDDRCVDLRAGAGGG